MSTNQRIILHCGGPNSTHRKIAFVKKCRETLIVPFGFGLEELSTSLAEIGWIVSKVVTPKPEEQVFDVLCARCGKATYGDGYAEALKVIRVRQTTGTAGAP